MACSIMVQVSEQWESGACLHPKPALPGSRLGWELPTKREYEHLYTSVILLPLMWRAISSGLEVLFYIEHVFLTCPMPKRKLRQLSGSPKAIPDKSDLIYLKPERHCRKITAIDFPQSL